MKAILCPVVTYSSVFAVSIDSYQNVTELEPKQGDPEFSQLLVLLTQFLTEVRNDIQGLKTTLTRVQGELDTLWLETTEGMTSSANKINQLTTDVNLLQQTVVPDINGRIGSLQQQVGGVSQALSSLRSVAITDIKLTLSPIEYSTIWKGPGYNDQVGYVITEVSNFNRDEYLDTAGRRKLIKMVNGNWHNVGA